MDGWMDGRRDGWMDVVTRLPIFGLEGESDEWAQPSELVCFSTILEYDRYTCKFMQCPKVQAV